MTFTPNIPQSGQSLGQTRDAVRNNFTNYNTVVSVDHVAPNSSGEGQHKQVTLNTFGAFPYAASGSESFAGSINASAAGTQLVYQPSVATIYVPVSPRALCRIHRAAGVFSLGNGPYGAGTNFNVGSVTTIGSSLVQVNFSSALATADYFVFVNSDASLGTQSASFGIVTKLTTSFQISINGANLNDLVVMVY